VVCESPSALSLPSSSLSFKAEIRRVLKANLARNFRFQFLAGLLLCLAYSALCRPNNVDVRLVDKLGLHFEFLVLGALYPSKSGLMNKHIVKHIVNSSRSGQQM
jgi:hypothetical protein